ncbi:hypothetical protein XELAEV_18038617mg [Xenopus laevis]|uniref:Uncharacterized protein n=1 Tax=Xenopus laevis TaxID=8355 RepID=A0A974H745_XENLA|nr:hypothetical protein XELAEV_18038617mg [Xenopus laevis]
MFKRKTELLCKINALNPEVKLVSNDIQSQYTSIPQDEGIRVVENALFLSPQLVYFILDCLSMVLQKNYFRFAGNFYWQRQGTSMGAAVALAFAKLYHLVQRFIGRTKKDTYACLNCVCCTLVNKGEKINHPLYGTFIQLKHYAACDTCNVVYLLKCPCGMVYLVQTARQLKTQIKGHRGNIRNCQKGIYTHRAAARQLLQ